METVQEGRSDVGVVEGTAKPDNAKPDYTVERDGNLFLFQPENGEAWIHLRDVTDGTWFGGRLVAEGRYAGELAQGLIDDGWKVR